MHAMQCSNEKGTLVRVFETRSGKLIGEYRRGVDHADITQIVFNKQADKIAVASDKGTVHVFNLSTSNKEANIPLIMRSVLPKYFKSEWSFAQLRLKEGRHSISFVADQDNAIVVASFDGLYHKYVYDVDHGGEAVHVCTKSL